MGEWESGRRGEGVKEIKQIMDIKKFNDDKKSFIFSDSVVLIYSITG